MAATEFFSPVIVANVDDLTRDEWLEIRRSGIGGSDVAAMLGLSPWTSPLSLYFDKLGELAPIDVTEPMFWGSRLEATIAEVFAERSGFTVTRIPAVLRHPEHPWMLANLDGGVVFGDVDPDDLAAMTPAEVLDVTEAAVEIKTTNVFSKGEWFDPDGNLIVPDHYQTQVQWYLAVTGLPGAWVVVLILGDPDPFHWTWLPRDDELIALLIEAGAKFWARVERRDPPLADGSDATTEALKAVFADPDPGAETELPADEAAELIRTIRTTKALIKAEEIDLAAAENRLKQLLGDAEVGLVDGLQVCTWKASETTRLDGKALKAAHPDIAAEFSTTTKQRRLHIPKEKDE